MNVRACGPRSPRALPSVLSTVAVLGALVVLTAARPARADLAEGLVGYWKLDEVTTADGMVAADASGRKHDGVYVNGPVSSPRVPAVRYADPRSATFTRAAHQAVRIAGLPAELEPAAVTISAWILTTTSDAERSELVSAGDSYILYLTATGLGAGRREAGGWSDVVAPLPGLLDGHWHHVAATIDGDGLEVFADGASVARIAKAGALVYDLGPDLWLGRFGNGTLTRDFEGNLDEVAVFARTLTSDEIAALARGAEPGAVVTRADGGADAPQAPDADARDGAPEVAPVPVDVVDAGLTPQSEVDAGSVDPSALRHQFQDAPMTCAAGGGRGAPWLGLASFAALVALTGTRRRGPAPRR